jgi:hypothetical protein
VAHVPALGGAAWLAALALPMPATLRILLLGPLVLAPSLLRQLPGRDLWAGIGTHRLAPVALLAALPLVPAATLAPGLAAAVLATPWLALSLACAIAGLTDAVRRGRVILRSAADVATDAALALLAVGSTFLVLDRLGVPPLALSEAIVTLTAVHFHFAAFGLLGVAGLLAAEDASPWPAAAIAGLLAGIPLTALGFTLDDPRVGAAGAVLVAAGGLTLAARLAVGIRTGDRSLVVTRVLPAGALAAGMVLAPVWAWSTVTGFATLDLDTMVRTHGVLNAAAVLILAAGWQSSRCRR